LRDLGTENLFKNSEGVWNRRQMNIFQGLKPRVISAFFGTTEVVPFQISLAMGVFIPALRAEARVLFRCFRSAGANEKARYIALIPLKNLLKRRIFARKRLIFGVLVYHQDNRGCFDLMP